MDTTYTCARCGYACDAQSALNGTDITPKDGDISVCLACGNLARFVIGALGLSIRELSEAEHDELTADEDIRRVLAVRARVVGDDIRPK